MHMKKILIAGCVSLMLAPFFVQADPIIRSGDAISIDASQVLEGNFYGLASTINISGTANEDVHVAGGRVTINGLVNKDLSILGGTVNVHGEVGDDLRVVGGDIVLATAVAGDVFVIGGTLTILSTATVEGDVIFYGKELLIDGRVNGSVHGSSENVRINTAIGGNVEYKATRSFVLGDRADISGDVTYTGFNEIVRAQGALVSGDVRHIKNTIENTRDFMQAWVIIFATLLFSGLTMYFVSRRFVSRFVASSHASVGTTGLVGLVAFLVAPLVSTVLLVSVVGSIVGILFIVGYILLLIASFVFSTILTGSLFQKYILKKDELTIFTPIIGVCVYLLIFIIPFLGTFIIFGLIMISLGTFVRLIYGKIKL